MTASNAPRCRRRCILNGRRQLLFTWKLVVLLAVCNVVCHWHLPLLVAASSPSSWSSSDDDVRHRYVNWLEEEHGVKVLMNEDSFQQALEEGAASFRHGSVLHQQPPQLLLTLVTAASCPHSAELLVTMEQAIPLVQEYWNDPIRQASLQSKSRPLFGKIDGSKLEDPALLQRMGVVAYPTLLFVSNVEGQQQQQQHPAHSYRYRHREYPEQEEEDDNTSDITTTTKLVFLDYLGLHDTPQHIAETVLLFYYRMVVAPRHYTNDTIMVHVLPIPMATLHHVQAFVEQHTPGFLRPTRSLTLSPELSQEERDYITWLLSSFRWNQPLPRSKNSNSDDADTTLDDLEEDDLIVFVQCRDPDNTVVDSRAATWTTVFDEMSTLLSSRPDRAFFSVGDCSPERLEARDVVAYRRPVTRTADAVTDWNELPHVSYMEVLASSSTNSLDLKSFLVQQATPSVLWFDRQSTAPILFHKSRKVHAVLFVDMHYPMLHDDHNHHDAAAAAAASGGGGGGGGSSSKSHPHSQNKSYSPQDLRQQEIVRQFQMACRHHQRRQRGNDDMACLIVPSTETRILTTFGIDIWSHWDANITTRSGSPPRQDATTSSPTTHHPPDMLPVVLITDQRIPGNTLRYYLEPGAIISKSTAIVDFVQDFWANRLKPEILSSGSMSPRRKGRAIALTGQTFDLELLQQGHAHHRLVLFYAPTCGHCKRFFLLWNQLADLIKYVEWDSFLTLYKLDVTDNEVHHPAEWNMTLHWLPDLYYFPPSLPAADGDSDRKLQEQPIRYYREDTRGDGVGRLNHPLEVLEWLLDVGDFDEFALLRLLEREEVSKSSHNFKETVFPRQDKKAEGASAND